MKTVHCVVPLQQLSFLFECTALIIQIHNCQYIENTQRFISSSTVHESKNKKPGIYVCSPGLNQIRKSEHEITKSNNGIGTNDSVAGLLQDCEQQRKMCLTELRTAATTSAHPTMTAAY